MIQRERLTAQSLLAAAGDDEAMELDEDFLRALEHGAPPMGGIGLEHRSSDYAAGRRPGPGASGYRGASARYSRDDSVPAHEAGSLISYLEGLTRSARVCAGVPGLNARRAAGACARGPPLASCPSESGTQP